MTVVALEELQTRSRFISEIAAQGCAYVVEGDAGLARVPSQRRKGQSVLLMWSLKAEAARWADALVKAPKVVAVSCETLLTRQLPHASEDTSLIGADWSDAPAEPELTAYDLDQSLRRHYIQQLTESATKMRHVWVLKAADAFATLLTRHPAGGDVLPIFADRASAERMIEGAWSQTSATRVPIGDFLQKTIVWCAEGRRRIAPAYIPGPGLVEMQPWDVKALLSGHAPIRRVA